MGGVLLQGPRAASSQHFTGGGAWLWPGQAQVVGEVAQTGQSPPAPWGLPGPGGWVGWEAGWRLDIQRVGLAQLWGGRAAGVSRSPSSPLAKQSRHKICK